MLSTHLLRPKLRKHWQIWALPMPMTCAKSTLATLKQSMGGVTQSVFWQLVAVAENRTAQQLSAEQRTFWQTKLRTYPPVAIFPPEQEMTHFMRLALQQAIQAAELGEIPVGALVVHQGKIIAQAHNQCVSQHNVSQHAEIRALAQAGQSQQNYRLNDCDLYVTLDPRTVYHVPAQSCKHAYTA